MATAEQIDPEEKCDEEKNETRHQVSVFYLRYFYEYLT